jgi:exodeoxyribonuclease V gamma subunit
MPGIHLYSGNRLETLADAFAGLLQAEPLPPLAEEIILVQSRGMARWLAMETAARLNIWANCSCPFPNTFIRSVYALLLPDIPTESPFAKDLTLWHLMAILPEVMAQPRYSLVRSYLESGDDLTLYGLAAEIADLFDQYSLYRPDMILEWEAAAAIPAEHAWQADLYRSLKERLRQYSDGPVYHRARLLEMFEKKIKAPDFDPALLPSRVSVFGISSLPPYHLRVLAGLARHIDIAFFVMNPCREYWFDIIADRDIGKISHRTSLSPETLHLSRGNSLLASMGHLGRDFMAMLQDVYTDEAELFEEPGSATLLQQIQQDILHLRDTAAPGTSDQDKRKINAADTSLVFHSCHSPMREVEVLHDQLLELFNTATVEEPLEPRDILVMAPDINLYAPLVGAVFDGQSGNHRKIGYTVADQSIRETSPYLEAFFSILRLPQGRFTSIDVFEILEAQPVRNRFSISDEDLVAIEKWIRETRICWGIDGEHKKNLQLPPHPENTWQAGIDRLLLGYAMTGADEHLFAGILPYDRVGGNDTLLLGSFLDFTDVLFSLAKSLQQRHSPGAWADILLQAKEDLLLADTASEEEERSLHRLLYRLKDLEGQTGYRTTVSLGVIRAFLRRSLDERFSPLTGRAGFLAGGVTFCSMLPMRAIPFKAIFLLGMDDGLYPRTGRKRSFDLMVSAPRRGDRSRRYDDRYLFLETILSARRKLSISFVGQSIQDNTRRSPSVLVSELQNYIDHGFRNAAGPNEAAAPLSETLTTHHHLQPFHPDYFSPQADHPGSEKFFSYATENCEAAEALLSGPQSGIPLFSSPGELLQEQPEEVTLSDLVSFFSHPARYLLVKILGMAPIEENQALETSEPFTLEGLAKYRLENAIVECLLQHEGCDSLFAVRKAAGELPHGEMGKTWFNLLVNKLQPFCARISELLAGQERQQVAVDLAVGATRITGRLAGVTPFGLLLYRHASLKPKDIIRAWISHLVLNSLPEATLPGRGTITFQAEKDSVYHYTPVTESRRHLAALLDLYREGSRAPLPLFPATSHAFAAAIHKGQSVEKAMEKAMVAWEGDRFRSQGEKNDPYNRLCWNNVAFPEKLFIKLAETVFSPALEHREKYQGNSLEPDAPQ